MQSAGNSNPFPVLWQLNNRYGLCQSWKWFQPPKEDWSWSKGMMIMRLNNIHQQPAPGYRYVITTLKAVLSGGVFPYGHQVCCATSSVSWYC